VKRTRAGKTELGYVAFEIFSVEAADFERVVRFH
jgi:hypothetical protein